ncbi:arabinose 5-phosphate isomerase KpsF-like isoform X2 [Dysidea avara]|uniref:arabinose 5-phosphate isomerase KpsF-like isoform X2 n=1 Tax=Dysidea avara TaxID=196820 RepID=UPI0033320C27
MASNGTSEHCCLNGDLLPPKTKRPAMMNGASNGVTKATNSISSRVEGLEKYSHFVDSMWKDIAAAQAACASIDNSEIVRFLDVLENSDGILVSGMGKSGIVGQRLSSSLASIGALSNYVHGAEWGHGDLDSLLSKTCQYCLHYKSDTMEEPFKLVPTCSIVVQEMISNAILRDLMQRKSVTKSMFRDNHPGGSIGRILAQESQD